jgi:hypothetical protein
MELSVQPEQLPRDNIFKIYVNKITSGRAGGYPTLRLTLDMSELNLHPIE